MLYCPIGISMYAVNVGFAARSAGFFKKYFEKVESAIAETASDVASAVAKDRTILFCKSRYTSTDLGMFLKICYIF